MISKAGKAVLAEYTLLNVLPRDVADAHVSGAINVQGIGTWVLKPNEVMHDLRFFLQHGLERVSPLQLALEAPKNLETALTLAFNVLLHTSVEAEETQTFNYFNVFLAPFIKGMDSCVSL